MDRTISFESKHYSGDKHIEHVMALNSLYSRSYHFSRNLSIEILLLRTIQWNVVSRNFDMDFFYIENDRRETLTT